MVVIRAILVLFLFLASAYCLLGVLSVADPSPPDDPYAVPWACGWLVGSVLLGSAAIRRLVILSRQPLSIPTPDCPAGDRRSGNPEKNVSNCTTE
jgi:hypothetical protein